MPALKFKLLGGLGNQVGRDGLEYCSSTLNWYAHQGALKKRKGMSVIGTVPASETTSGVYFARSVNAAVPGSVVAYGSLPLTLPTGAKEDTVWIGADSPFSRFRIAGAPGTDSTLPSVFHVNQYSITDGIHFRYGSAPANDLFPAMIHVGAYDTATDIAIIGPWFPLSGSASGTAVATLSDQLECAFEPPSDWATSTVGGQTKYWVSIQLPIIITAGSTITSGGVCLTENRVMNVLSFTDRSETPHLFTASMYSNDGKQLRFTMDGTTLSQSVDLQPDGNSRVFGPSQMVFSAYHGASDRVIGYIQDYGWFYAIPGVPSVFSLPADDLGTDTEFVNIKGGLRSFLPESNGILIADTRIFAWKDQTISWSAPGALVDVWPNASEIFLDDGYGPITGAAFMNGSILFFKRRAIYSVQLNGNDTADTEYDAVPISTNVGCVGGLCPAGDSLFFVGEDGLYRFNGRVAAKLTSKFDEEFLTGKIGMDFSKTKAAYYSPLGQVRFFFPFESSDILDRALYVNTAGVVVQTEDGTDDSVFSAWPQGRVSTTSGEYGFQATAVCADYSTARPRNLIGDRFGFIHELDSGYGDGGYQVVAELTQSEQNYAGTGQALVGPVFLSQSGRATQNSVSVGIVPNNQQTEAKLISAQPFERGMARDYTIYASPTATCKITPGGVTKRLNAMIRAHSFGVYVLDNSIGLREINGFSVDIVPVGNRGF